MNGTKIYGASDDLIEIEGDLNVEIDCDQHTRNSKEILLICSDGTVLEVNYGKGDEGIWSINVVVEGKLFFEYRICTNENAIPYSDQVFFDNGLKWVRVASEWYVAKEWDKNMGITT